MNTSNTAAKLIRGSKEIDRMENEIHALVSMLSGLVIKRIEEELEASKSWERTADEIVADYIFEGGHWRISGRVISGKPKYSGLEICCFIDVILNVPVYSSVEEKPFFTLGHIGRIEIMHRNLDVLVKGLLKKFPGITEKIKPFLQAADRFPES